MGDIAPKLIEDVTADFRKEYSGSTKIQALLNKVQDNTATYAEAQEYSLEVSGLIRKAYRKHVSSAGLPDGRMHYNIASRLIQETLGENHRLVSEYASSVQTALNKAANIGIKAQAVDVEQDRIDGLVSLAANAERYDDVAEELSTAIETYLQSIVDNSVKKNAEFQYRSGLSPKIIRRSEHKCCKWCSDLAGAYNYPDVPEDVYRRHGNCRCLVEYDPGEGKKQNVWTKVWM